MISLAQAQAATGGRWLSQPLPEGTELRGGAFDTRALCGAEIFFALAGERSDGHDHLAKLAGSGVRLAVVSRPVQVPGFGGALLQVDSPLQALADMARAVVERHRPYVIAITGSYGKTTAKEIVAHVLEGRRRVLKTPGSLNNEIGLPISLLGLDGSQDTCVLEFSARKPGDIEVLGRIAPPHLAVVMAVGRAHIGIFGSQQAIYRSKAEIFLHLRPGGLALVNGEDPQLKLLAEDVGPQPHRTLTFGRQGDLRAEEVSTDPQGRQRFTAVWGETRLALRSGLPGPHGLYPLLVAWAAARELGVPDEEVAARAPWHPGQKGRAVPVQGRGGGTILDDTYNASPETVINLIATLGAMAAPEKVLVLGHLSELEEGLEESAALIGRHLRPPLTRVFVHAPSAPHLARLLNAAAQGPTVVDLPRQADLIAALQGLDRPGTVIGIKGARSAHLERVVQGLLGARVDCTLSPCALLMHCTDCEAMTLQT